MISWQEIEDIIKQAQHPLHDHWLERLNFNYGKLQPYYRFLFLLADVLHPPLALEIGVDKAVASAHLAAGLAPWDGQVIGLDINPVHKANEIIDRFGNYWFWQVDAGSDEALDYVDRLIDRHGPIGIVYQDSSHHFIPTMHEWEIYSVRCKNAIWLCDDILPAFSNPAVDPPGKSMVSYWETLPEPKRLYPEILHNGNTQGIVIL